MKQPLLKNYFSKARQETVALNASNGNDAEFLAASSLVMAIGGEIHWGSRNEDGRKIDLICSYDHPWVEGERIFFFVQVKSGKTYGESTSKGFKLKSIAKSLAHRTTHPICLIWVDRDTNRLFWAYIHPQANSKTQEYRHDHIISPAIRFDIARYQSTSLPINRGGGGIIMKVDNKDFKLVRKEVLEKYRSFKTSGLYCPIFGKIEATRVGWRHMLRKTRSSINKGKSLITIKYIDQILKDIPTEIYVSECKLFEIGDFQHRSKEYVLIYQRVKIYDLNIMKVRDIKVVARIVEEIRWPANWKENSTLTQFVERKLVLLSCYYK